MKAGGRGAGPERRPELPISAPPPTFFAQMGLKSLTSDSRLTAAISAGGNNGQTSRFVIHLIPEGKTNF